MERDGMGVAVDILGYSNRPERLRVLGSGQAENIVHCIHAGAFVYYPACSPRCSEGEGVPRSSHMTKLDSFSRADQKNLMLPDGISSSERVKPDFSIGAGGFAETPVHRVFIEARCPGLSCGLAQGQRGPGGGVSLESMMGLDNFNIVVREGCCRV